MIGPHHRRPHKCLRLLRGPILMHPTAMLADVGHLEEIGIQPRLLADTAEGALMEHRRARGHHYPVQPLLLDILHDQRLSRIRAHKDIITGDRHPTKRSSILGYLSRIYRGGDVQPAVADINAGPCLHTIITVARGFSLA
ncbi:MAG: hypothetical protein DDT25_00659 [Chloroflexi bacterium]|nr:hypothetical protein [Chloroflexota bacterium]